MLGVILAGALPVGQVRAYDPVGNRLTRTIDTTTTTYTHDGADRLLTVDAGSVTVDAAGNLTARGSDSFDYDAAHRLIEATVGSVTTLSTYDGDGTRVGEQVESDPATTYLYDISGSLPVVLDDGTTRSVWGPGGLAWTVSGSDLEVPLADRLGSVRTVTDDEGAVVATVRTDEFGVVTASTGSPDTVHGFTGEPTDASGLVDLRSRRYDPELGRFLTRDTWSGEPTSSQTHNRYTYLANDPLNATDPSGHCGVDAAFDVGFVAFSAATLVGGPEKDFGTNALALGADVASLFIPCATGLGMLVRGGRVVDDVGDGLRLANEAWDLSRLSESGARQVGSDLTRSGQELAKHGGQGAFPVPKGTPSDISRQGQDQLDDILTDPGTLSREISGGNFKGGRYYIAPDGRGAAFDREGTFQYFGVFRP